MGSEQANSVDLKRYVLIVWHWLWLIILASIIAGGGALWVSSRSTPIYEASARLMIREGQKDTGLDYNSVLMSERLAMTYVQMLRDAPVLTEVIDRLQLSTSEEKLRGMIKAENVRDTLLINLKVRNSDRVVAAAIANTVAQVFIEQHEQIGLARYGSSLQSLSNEMERLQDLEEGDQQLLDAERAKEAPDSTEIARLETTLAQYRATYADLLQSYEEMSVAQASASESILLTKPATPPDSPILPRRGLNMAIASMVGAALALATAFLVDYLDDTIKEEGDVQRIVQLSTLATVWQFRPGLRKGVPLMVAQPESAAAEAYRLLRTNFQFSTLGMDSSATTVVVSSAESQEGKTTTVANLGVSLAQIGKQVLLVDTDLRRPSLHRHFGLSNDVGLTSLFLQQRPDPESVVKETGIEGLYVLTAGPVPANPAELMEHPHFQAMLAQLKGMVDYLILDSPPVLSVADTSILAQNAAGVLLVVQQSRTRSDALRAAVLRLREIKVRLFGVVLNQVHADTGPYYGHYYQSAKSALLRPQTGRRTPWSRVRRRAMAMPRARAGGRGRSAGEEPLLAARVRAAREPRAGGTGQPAEVERLPAVRVRAAGKAKAGRKARPVETEPSTAAPEGAAEEARAGARERPVEAEPSPAARVEAGGEGHSVEAELSPAACEEADGEAREGGRPWRVAGLRTALAAVAVVAVALFTYPHWGDLSDRIRAVLPGDAFGSSPRVPIESAAVGRILSTSKLLSRNKLLPPTPTGTAEGARLEAGRVVSPVVHGTPTPIHGPTPASAVEGARLEAGRVVSPVAHGTPTPIHGPTPIPEPWRATGLTESPRPLVASLSLRDGLGQYGVGKPVYFLLDIRNQSDAAASFGALELWVSGSGEYRAPWTDIVIEPGQVFHAEYYLVFHSAGTYAVTEAICYGEARSSDLEGAEWEAVSPSVVVDIG